MRLRGLLVFLCTTCLLNDVFGETEKDKGLIKIGGDTYSLLKRPSPTSELVKEARADISITLDFEDIPKDLVFMANFFQLAENGLVAYPKLQGKVKVSQIEVLQLTDESEVAITNFARVSSRVLDDLESTYYYLHNGKIKLAMRIYTSVAEEAERMARKAEDLHKQYNSQVEKLKKILEETFEAQETETKKKDQSISDKRNFTAELKKLEVLKDEAQKKFAQMQSLFYEAKAKEHKALKKQNNPLKRLVNVVTKKFVGSEMFDMGAYKDAAKAYREAKNRYFEEMEKIRDARNEVLATIAEYAERMKNCDDVNQLAEIAIEALQNVIGELQHVIGVLVNAARFWNHMSGHLEDLKKGDLLKFLEEGEYEEELRSPRFIEMAVKNYARWVATYEMMRYFRKDMKPARDKLAQVVKTSMTKEEALKNIKVLGSELSAEGRNYQRQITHDHSKHEL